MPQTVEVRFKGIRRDFFLWPDEQEPLLLREGVVVEAERGVDFGRVVTAGEAALKKCGGACTACSVGEGIKEESQGGAVMESATPEETAVALTEAPAAAEATDTLLEFPPEEEPTRPVREAPAGLKTVLRRATQEDIRQHNDLRRAEEDARRQIAEKVRSHHLDMKVSDIEWQWDRGRLTIYFTAEKRIDFRNLVRDLAQIFRTRIELRQIGVRDEAARLGGVGRCGREYCCSTWLTELSPVSLALAKDQHLSLNPTQISGGCGRLLCCLRYEHEFYVASRKRFPREGKTIATARGAEKVIAVDIFRERVFLRHEGEGSRIVPLVDLREEMELAASGSVPALPAAPAPPSRRPDPRPPRSERPTRPLRSEPQAGPQPPSKAPPAPRPERGRPPRTDRPREEAPREQRQRDPRAGNDATPPNAPPLPPAAGDQAPTEGSRRPRRRRRGRRGGRGGSGGPPPASES